MAITSLGAEDAMHSIIDMFSHIFWVGLTILLLLERGFYSGHIFHLFTVSKLLAYFLNYVIDSPTFLARKMICDERKEFRFTFIAIKQILLRKTWQ